MRFFEMEFVENNVKIEHGHKYDLFNAPDPSGTLKPFGYDSFTIFATLA